MAPTVESACKVGDPGLIPGLGRCPGEGDGASAGGPAQAVSGEARRTGAGRASPHLPAGNVAPSLCLRPGPQESSYLRHHR